MSIWAIDDCFNWNVCLEHKIVLENKIMHPLVWKTIFQSIVMRFVNDFHSWLGYSWQSLANNLTRNTKSLFPVTRALFYIYTVCIFLAIDYFQIPEKASTLVTMVTVARLHRSGDPNRLCLLKITLL